MRTQPSPEPLVKRSPLLTGTTVEAKRDEVLKYFQSTCDLYESLFETLRTDDAFFGRPDPLRHPLIFYFGHTATFFINKLVLAGLTTRIDPGLESICAVGVDEMSWDELDETHYDWPSVERVRSYRAKVRAVVEGLIRELPLSLPVTWESPWWPILMGVEHELIHVETSSVLIRQHSLEHVKEHSAWTACAESAQAPVNCLIDVPKGVVTLGKKHEPDHRFGWDNEYGHRHQEVPAFQASRYLVSNKEFLAFVEAGGYTTPALWGEEGKAWRKYTQAIQPTFWIKEDDSYRLRLMTHEVPMPWDWPAEVNCHEARAFCSWKSRSSGVAVRLLTEDEWYRLLEVSEPGEVPVNELAGGNLHLDHYASACPVNQFAQGDFFDVTGNVWQWTQTTMYPFEGFKVHPLYDDFTTPTFDDRHNLMKGGSFISCGNESLHAARYAFRRHFFQHAGFRYATGEVPESVQTSHYETDRLLSEYAEFHYGDRYFDVPNFSQALAQIGIAAAGDSRKGSALDLGCASGRSTFELAKHFDRVTGVDFSARFIGQGVQMAEQGALRYTLAEEGELVSYHERTLEGLGLAETRAKVEFYQGDACNLVPRFTGYDFLLAANLIDRLYDPKLFLSAIHKRLKVGGLLMITSPYTWLTEHTKRSAWVGGFKRDGESFTTLDGLKEILSANFRLVEGPLSVPFVIRETRRKHQHTISEVTIWERSA